MVRFSGGTNVKKGDKKLDIKKAEKTLKKKLKTHAKKQKKKNKLNVPENSSSPSLSSGVKRIVYVAVI